MKKLLALLLAVILVLSLAACTSTAKDDEPASDAAKLTMATEATFPPYEYYDGDAIVGIDVEVAQAIAEKVQRKHYKRNDYGRDYQSERIGFKSVQRIGGQ